MLKKIANKLDYVWFPVFFVLLVVIGIALGLASFGLVTSDIKATEDPAERGCLWIALAIYIHAILAGSSPGSNKKSG